MVYPVIFANLAAGNQPLSDFDTMFQQVAAMLAIPCTATGTNAITATPNTNCPVLASYSNLCSFLFRAANTSTGAVTFQQAGLASLPVYRADGVTQAGAGDVNAGILYTAVFVQALNSGAGGFFLEFSVIQPAASVSGGSFANLVIVHDPSFPDTQIDVTADEIVMVNRSTGAVINAQFPSFIINTANVGVVNGLDTGTLQQSTWYYVWAISNGTTTGGLLSLSATAPTLPSGYNFVKRIGARKTDPNNGATGTGTFTVTIASPAVITKTAHGLVSGSQFVPTTTGSLPTGMTPGNTYYVIATGLTANTFEFAAVPNGTPINTSGSQSGTQTMTVPNPRLQRIVQRNRRAQWSLAGLATSTILPPNLGFGPVGTFSTTNPVLVTIGLFPAAMPATAAAIRVATWNNIQGLTGSNILVAPNANWGGTGFGPSGISANMFPLYSPSGAQTGMSVEMEHEGGTIAWCADNAGGAIYGMGWADNI